MKHYFLNLVYTCGDKKLYEIAVYEETPLEWKLIYTDEGGLKDLYNEGAQYDFGLKEGYLLWDGEQTEIDSDTYNKYLDTVIPFKNNVQTIYQDLLKLSELGGYYVSSSFLESLKSTPLDYGYSRLTDLQVSQSTMKIYVRVKREDGWRIRSLVEMDGTLKMVPFNFMVPKGTVLDEKTFGPVKRLGEYVVKGREYDFYYYDRGRSIYPHFTPFLKIVGPLLNHKIFNMEQGKLAVKFLSYYIDYVIKVLTPDLEEEEKIPEAREIDRDYNVDRSGAFFRLVGKKPSRSEFYQMLKDTIFVYEKMLKESWTLKQGIDHFRGIGYEPLKLFSCVVLIKVMASSNTNMFDRLDTARLTLKNLKTKNLRLELELFSLRAAIWLEDYELPYRSDRMYMQGGQSVYTSEVRKVKNIGGSK